MQAFKKVDMESWPRREHYRYYTEALKVEFNMTAPVDVQNLLRFCHAHGCKFYAAAIYCVTKALGRIENFRMFKNADGELCVWDKIVPNFTFFHPDDCTFSDCWTDFSEDFPTFYNAITADMQTYKDVKGIKTKPNQPANFYCVSCTPWTAFTGCGSRVADGQPAYFPIVVMGRYEKCGGKVNMPVNITIAHAVADGYHAGLFFRKNSISCANYTKIHALLCEERGFSYSFCPNIAPSSISTSSIGITVPSVRVSRRANSSAFLTTPETVRYAPPDLRSSGTK